MDFAVTRIIGKGGFSLVLGTITGEKQQSFACKVLLSAEPLDEQQFRWEYMILSRLRHPCIPAVHSYAYLEQELSCPDSHGMSYTLKPQSPYFMMDLVDGPTLLDYAANSGSVQKLLPLFTQLAWTLTCLHDQGLIHGDLKPQNVLVFDEVIKLIDFGTIRSISGALAQSTVGTPFYSAPEVEAGQAITVRAELFSLGMCCLHASNPHLTLPTKLEYRDEWRTAALMNLTSLGVAPAIIKVLEQLTQPDPAERPSGGWSVLDELFASGQALPSYFGALKTVGNPDLVGRHAELQKLEAFYDDPTCSALLVCAGPGMGKTRLLREWLIEKEFAGVCCRRLTQGVDTAGFSMLPLTLASFLQELGQVNQSAYGSDQDAFDVESRINSLLGQLDNQQVSEQNKKIVVIDAWSPATGKFAHLEQRLLEASAALPYKLILSGESLPATPQLANIIELPGLTVEETKILIRNLLAAAHIRDDVVEAIHQAGQGNPAFIIDIVNYLVVEDHVTRRNGVIQVDVEACRELASMTINDLAAERVRALDGQSLTIVQILAWCANPLKLENIITFWRLAFPPESRGLTSQLPDLFSLTALMVDLEFRAIVKSLADPRGGKRFQVATQELERAAYVSVPSLRRRVWHAAAAATLSAANANPDGYEAMEIGRHYDLAGDTYSACSWYLLAGDLLIKANDYPRADDLLRNVTEHKELLSDQQRGNLLFALAQTAITQNRSAEALDVLLELQADDKALASFGAGTKVYLALGRAYRDQANFDQALTMFNQALQLANQEFPDEQALHADIHAHIGWVYVSQGRESEAEEQFKLVQQLAGDREDLLPKHKVLLDYAALYHRQGKYREAVQASERALALAAGKATLSELGVTHHQLSMSLREMKETDQALHHAVQAQKFFEQISDNPHLLNSLINQAMIHTSTRRYDEALKVLELPSGIAEASRNPPVQITLALLTAECLYEMGRYADESKVLLNIVDLASRAKDKNHTRIAALISRSEWILDHKKSAAQWLKTAQELYPTIEDRYAKATAARCIAEAAERLGDLAAAQQWLSVAVKAYEHNGSLDYACTTQAQAVRVAYCRSLPSEELTILQADLERYITLTNPKIKRNLILTIAQALLPYIPKLSILDWLVEARRLALSAGDREVQAVAERLLTSLTESSSWTEKALEVATSVLKAISDPEAVYQILTKLALDIAEAERGALVDVVNGRPNILIAGYEGREMMDGMLAQLSRTVMQEVITTKRAIMSGNIRFDPKLAETESLRRDCVTSVLCLPVVEAESLPILAVLYLDHRDKEHAFDAAKIKALQELAAKIATVVRVAKTNLEREQLLQTMVVDQDSQFVYAPNNPVMTKLVKEATLWADNDTLPILITGPTGAGKEALANFIHQQSSRRDKIFMPVNCAALTEQLFESEIFGYVRGAFSGAFKDRPGKAMAANYGTLFLDEFGELSHYLQAKLLRLLEQQEIQPVGSDAVAISNARVILATNLDLTNPEEAGRIRSDILYRCKIRLHLPPLAERLQDIPYLVHHFLQLPKLKQTKISQQAMERLIQATWRGNVRELLTTVELAAVRCNYTEITHQNLELNLLAANHGPASNHELPATASNHIQDQWLKSLLTERLQKYDGDVDAVAAELNTNKSTVYRKIKKVGLKASDFRRGKK